MSFFDDASLAFLPSGAAGKDGKAYSIKPVPVYGSELVTNGDFASNINDWAAKDCTIVWDNGKIKCDNSSGNGGGGPRQNVGLQNSKTYRFTATIQLISASANGTFGIFTSTAGGTGQSTVYTGSTLVAGGDAVTEIGEFTTGTDGDVSIQFNVDRTNAVFTVDNVSVKEVLVGDGDFTFSRGSNLAATRVGADGLIEKGRENLLTYSNDFSNAAWATANTSVTSGQSGYDGSSDAWLVDISGGVNSQHIRQSATASGVTSYSIYAKANTLDWILLYVQASQVTRCYFDIANGVLGGTNNLIDSKIESVGNGYYRCTIVYSNSITQVRLYLASGDGNITQSSGSIYIQDAQLEEGLAATDVISTGATTGKAGLLEDEPRFDYSGGATCPSLLLEPSRTNLVTQSEYLESFPTKSSISVISNAAISPDGLQNASKLIPTTSNNANHYIRTDISVVNGSEYVMSFFAKKGEYNYVNTYTSAYSTGVTATWDLNAGVVALGSPNADIEDYGNGWYRCIWKGTTNTTSLSYRIYISEFENRNTSFAGDGTKGAYIYGAQLEQGSYPTSYIPNHSGGSVTRGVDFNRVLNQQEIINATEGTLFLDTTLDYIEPTMFLGGIYGGGNELYFATFSSNQFRMVHYYGSTQALIVSNTFSTGRFKMLLTYKNNDWKFYINGVLQGVDTNGTFDGTNMSQFATSYISSSVYSPNQKVHQLLYFGEILSDEDCIALTTL